MPAPELRAGRASWLGGVILALTAQLPACAADHAAAVQQTLSASQCGFARAGVHLITSQAQWQRLPLNQWSGKTRPSGWPAHQWRLVVALGNRPTLGYGLSLTRARKHDAQLELDIQTHGPQPGLARGQMLTSPCLVLAIPDQGWSDLVIRGLDHQPITLHHP